MLMALNPFGSMRRLMGKQGRVLERMAVVGQRGGNLLPDVRHSSLNDGRAETHSALTLTLKIRDSDGHVEGSSSPISVATRDGERAVASSAHGPRRGGSVSPEDRNGEVLCAPPGKSVDEGGHRSLELA